jgi:hypothetical protein
MKRPVYIYLHTRHFRARLVTSVPFRSNLTAATET